MHLVVAQRQLRVRPMLPIRLATVFALSLIACAAGPGGAAGAQEMATDALADPTPHAATRPDSTGRALDRASGTAVAEPQEQARPAFVLPDIRVEGEDLSRLAGGVRLLPPDIPAIGPETEPQPIGVGPTRYRPRRSLPFVIDLPRPDHGTQTRALTRLRAAQGPWITVAGLWLPTRRMLIAGEADVQRDRIPGREAQGMLLGAAHVAPGEHPAQRLAGALRFQQDEWQPHEGSLWQHNATKTVWRGSLEGERRLRLARQDARAGLRLAGARGKTQVSPAGEPTAVWDGRWAAVRARLAAGPELADLRLLAPRARAAAGLGRDELAFDLLAAFVHRDETARAAEGEAEWLTRAGWLHARERLVWLAGAAAGGDGTDAVAGPWLQVRRGWPVRGLLLAVELGPSVTFAEERLTQPDRLPPAMLLRPADEPWLPPWPAPTLAATSIGAQYAWPRLSGELLWQGAQGWTWLEATWAHVRDPLDWEPREVGGESYFVAPRAAGDRAVWRFGCELRRRLGIRSAWHLEYRWMRDGEPAGGEGALHYLPEHRLRTGLSGYQGSWRWALGVVLASRTDRPAATPAATAFVDLEARVGWRFEHAVLSLVGRNLFGEPVATRFGEVDDARWFGLEWQQRFTTPGGRGPA